MLADACLKAASAQIRNRATIGGNVLQKTRCAYFRAEAPLPWGCNKREPGTGCAARHGLNERHAIFGWTDACVAVQPSDPLVALAALDAEVELLGREGRRTLRVADLHLTQEEAEQEGGDAARLETRLQPGEIIVAYHLPIREGQRSAYVKVRERASYEYALVSAAAVLSLTNGTIGRAAIALGSVAQKPWRLAAAEAAAGRPTAHARGRAADHPGGVGGRAPARSQRLQGHHGCGRRHPRHRRGGRCGMSVGTRRTRIEGSLKVTGAAKYAADNYPAGLLHAVLVGSPRASGTVTAIDTARAEAVPGVIAGHNARRHAPHGPHLHARGRSPVFL